ncbi:DUF3566 domain-containing protein [Nocardioides pocheonensis]|uniref:DUF3566 domain-containing protein n=1 Tax=Nocardioides pocheonensis TaxID=661485 RepID=A0A3N0GJI3_9ACTN|nr:DUF3566 domain-containing protein [Nocardioides pocheonensis]RNM12599.1 DUF3566 domain-containing protein [Nocardioides pocheonensis]
MTDRKVRDEVVLPPPPEDLIRDDDRGRKDRPAAPPEHVRPVASGAATRGTVRKARLRLVQVEPWSVMKTAFMLSIAIGIVTVVAVGIVWGVLGAAGLWDSVNSIVQDSIGDSSGSPFEIQKYLGTTRVLGFTMIVAVADVILITAIATLGAFLYNLAAGLLGGIEVTFAEDN